MTSGEQGTFRRTRRRWRDYVAPGGGRPIREFVGRLTLDDQVVIAAAMREVRIHGTARARHLVGDLYEVRAFAADRGYRILFAEQGRRSQVLLALHAVRKQSQRTPRSAIATAQARLAQWHRRATPYAE